MNKPDLGRAMLGGFLGTVAMSILFWVGKAAGMPDLDMAAILGAIFNGGILPPTLSAAWWTGLIVHFVLGSWIFPLTYVSAFYPIYWGGPALRGFLFAVGLWIMMSLLFLPMFRLGVFGFRTYHPMLFLGAYFIAHAVYGIIVGVVAGPARESAATKTPAATA